MEFLRNNEIERMVIGVYLRTKEEIPELDALAESDMADIKAGHTPRRTVTAAEKLYLGIPDHPVYLYKILAPSSWFWLGGWA